MTSATPIGPLVVSLVPRSLEGLARALSARVHRGSDVVEVRLDFIAGEILRKPDGFREILGSAGRPVIAALHGNEGFGTFDGTPSDRRGALLVARAAGAFYLDVDEALAGAVGDLGGPTIFSTHGVAPVPGALSEAAARAEALRQGEEDLVKLVPACGDARDGLSVLEWLSARAEGSTIAFGSGELARFTRMLAPAFGSALVYAAPFQEAEDFDAFDLVPAAPGQPSVALLRRVWPHGGPGPRTAIAAVVGVPIDHSAGPVVHGAACRAAGVDGMLVPVAPDALADLWAFPAVRSRLCGLSVTAPFKGDAATAAVECDGATLSTGAANTLVPGAAGDWLARNTDAPAVSLSFAQAGAQLQGAEALVIGAGGAGRAAAYALAEGGARVTVAARRVEQAEALAESLSTSLGSVIAAAALDGPVYRAMRPDLIVHTTPLGTNGKGCPPITSSMIRVGSWTMDAVYKPKRTELLGRVAEWGGGVLSGEGWFLGQAWLQHLMVFADSYADAHAGPGVASGFDPKANDDLAVHMRAGMASALGWWGGQGTRVGRPSVLALVGLRGAGKTTVGQAAAKELGAGWLDLDVEVAKAAGLGSAAEVIERDGLLRFRLRESEALATAMDGAAAEMERSGLPTVVSTGGGIVESERAIDLLDQGALTVWLRAPIEVLARRVAADAVRGSTVGAGGAGEPKRPQARPAIVSGAAAGSTAEFESLRERRDPIFDRLADFALAVDQISAGDAAREVCRSWIAAR